MILPDINLLLYADYPIRIHPRSSVVLFLFLDV